MYSEKEKSARKQVAIVAVSYFTNQGVQHISLSLSTFTAKMTIFCKSKKEAEDYEKESNTFILEGTIRQIRELSLSENEIIYTLDIDWIP